MYGSKVNPYQFAKNINNVKKLEDDIYNNQWIDNLIGNEIVNRESDVNINRRKAYYNNINNDINIFSNCLNCQNHQDL